LQDWLLFGLLAADLLDVDRQRLFSPRFTYSEVSDYIGVEEIRLLRTIVQLEPLARLDVEVVAERIDKVLNVLAAEIAGLHSVVRVGARPAQDWETALALGGQGRIVQTSFFSCGLSISHAKQYRRPRHLRFRHHLALQRFGILSTPRRARLPLSVH
jgi:hypothetical protein